MIALLFFNRPNLCYLLQIISCLQLPYLCCCCCLCVVEEEEMASLIGFRFKPTNEEIIDLLKMKRRDPGFSVHTIKEIAFYKHEPWELPGYSEIQSKEKVWFFFCEPIHKYSNSKRSHRRTKKGYWKCTGKGSDLRRKDSDEVIGKKKHVPFRLNGTAYKETKTEWVMHEISVENDPSYKKDYVVCRLERKRDGKQATSTCNEDQTSQDLTTCSTIDVAEDVHLESVQQPDEQQLVFNRVHVAENTNRDDEVLATDHLISYSGNHVAKNTSGDVILPFYQHLVSNNRNHVAENARLVSSLTSDHLISYSRNHAAENVPAESQLFDGQNLVSHHSSHVAETTAPESQPIVTPNLAADSRIHVAEIASPELQQPPVQDLISSSRNHVAENIFLEWETVPNENLESLKLQNQNTVSYSTTSLGNTLEVDPLLLAKCNANGGENGLNNAYSSPLQGPIYPEPESYCSGPSYGWDILSSPSYGDQVDDLINSLRGFQNDCSLEGTGLSFTSDSDFNSSKPDAGFNEGVSGIDTETFIQWVNQHFWELILLNEGVSGIDTETFIQWVAV